MILSLASSARFPAPEFENHTLPAMGLESYVSDTTLWRVLLVTMFLLLSGICLHRFRSRKAMILMCLAGLIVFGYLFKACPCPVGLFQNVADSAVNGHAISVGYLLLFVIPLATALVWGRLFCSGACPLGAVQELVSLKTLHVPNAVDRVLRMMPIGILIISSVLAASGAVYPVCYLDPYLPLFLLSFTFPFAVLTIVFLLVGLFISRPFCRYVCPYGALLRLFAIFAAKPPTITNSDCINCKLCEQGCPNNAILPPEDAQTTQLHHAGTQRLTLLVACLPLALFAGGLIGHVSAPMFAQLHPDVSLLDDLQANRKTSATRSFAVSGLAIENLQASAHRANNILSVGMSIGGMLMAGCVMAELIAQSRRRKNAHAYQIDSGLCLCCGRCYQACPLENKRVPGKVGHV
ncbi:MAG: 4Fe-4S binding protein [Phycisphaeraceae bacterium JB051]